MGSPSRFNALEISSPQFAIAHAADVPFIVDLLVQGMPTENFVLLPRAVAGQSSQPLSENAAVALLIEQLQGVIATQRLPRPGGTVWSQIFVLYRLSWAIGFSWLLDNGFAGSARELELNAITIVPSQRGLGFGSVLLRETLEFHDAHFPHYTLNAT